jgi:plasmid stability protein
MTQLLVRNLEPIIIKRLKERARLHGVAVEEEHRRILREVCLAPVQKVSLINFLRNPDNDASPAVELSVERSRQIESRPLDF